MTPRDIVINAGGGMKEDAEGTKWYQAQALAIVREYDAKYPKTQKGGRWERSWSSNDAAIELVKRAASQDRRFFISKGDLTKGGELADVTSQIHQGGKAVKGKMFNKLISKITNAKTKVKKDN
jgi:hypothetical protein